MGKRSKTFRCQDPSRRARLVNLDLIPCNLNSVIVPSFNIVVDAEFYATVSYHHHTS